MDCDYRMVRWSQVAVHYSANRLSTCSPCLAEVSTNGSGLSGAPSCLSLAASDCVVGVLAAPVARASLAGDYGTVTAWLAFTDPTWLAVYAWPTAAGATADWAGGRDHLQPRHLAWPRSRGDLIGRRLCSKNVRNVSSARCLRGDYSGLFCFGHGVLICQRSADHLVYRRGAGGGSGCLDWH